ncbi:MAG TPA: acetyl-CoA C-acyltransferase [Saprospiraceae bacterium]|nr:acetyl-CoA C-acyltransferase [Saprospiraceae bacterium]
MQKVYILSAKRTPIGSFGGKLSGFSAVDLGVISSFGAIAAASIDPAIIDEVYFGNVVQANLGQAPARQVALKAGLGNNVPCTTVNKVCSSGLKSVMLAAQSIQLGINDVVLAGGMESMSNIPHYLPHLRWGVKFGGSQVIDGLQRDGLIDVYDQKAMGVYADATAERYEISREEQDRFAIQSYTRAKEATESGKFINEISPISIPQRKGEPVIMDKDEEYTNVAFEKIPSLKPAFTSNGTVTAANASTINDGAASLILASEKFIKAHGLNPIAEVIGYADAAHEPQWFTTAPTIAAPKAIKNANLVQSDINLFEVNEAFSVVTMAFNQTLGIDESIVNIHGGAVALGHPLGASGARVLTTLIHGLQLEKKELGCATLCNGGGGASALVVRAM